MKRLDFAGLKRFMKKHSGFNARQCSQVFKIEDSKLIWTDGFMLIMAPAFDLASGLYNIDGSPATHNQYPRYKEATTLKGSASNRPQVIEYATAVKANPKIISCIFNSELSLTVITGSIALDKANAAVSLGCDSCQYWEKSGFYVFSGHGDSLKFFAGELKA